MAAQKKHGTGAVGFFFSRQLHAAAYALFSLGTIEKKTLALRKIKRYVNTGPESLYLRCPHLSEMLVDLSVIELKETPPYAYHTLLSLHRLNKYVAFLLFFVCFIMSIQ